MGKIGIFVSNEESSVKYFIPEESPRRQVVKTACLYCSTAPIDTHSICNFYNILGFYL